MKTMNLRYEDVNTGKIFGNHPSFESKMARINSFVIKRVESFGDYIIVIYRDKAFFDIFTKTATLMERRYVFTENQ